MSKNRELAVISNAINILCLECAASRKVVIRRLTGCLWDEEEAGELLHLESERFKTENLLSPEIFGGDER